MILALDLSSKSTGYAIFDGEKLIKSGFLVEESKDTYERIYGMIKRVSGLIEKYKIEKIIAEEVLPEIGGVNKQVRTYKVLIYLQALLEFVVHDNFKRVTIEYIFPSAWRKKCGILQGRNQTRSHLKIEDMRFVKRTFGMDIQNDDEADAICIGYAYTQPEIKMGWGEQ